MNVFEDSTNGDRAFDPEDESSDGFRLRVRFLMATLISVVVLARITSRRSIDKRFISRAILIGPPLLLIGLIGTFFPGMFGPPTDFNRSWLANLRSRPLGQNVVECAIGLAGLGLGLWLWFGYYMAG